MSCPGTPIPDPGWPSRRPTPHPRISILQPEPRPIATPTPLASLIQGTGFRSIPYDSTICANPPRRGISDGDAYLDPGSAAGTQATGGLAAIHFDLPASFTLFNRTHLHLHPRIYLATTKDQPLYRVSPKWNRVLLHSGPRPNDPTLATLKYKGFLTSSKGHVMLASGMKETIALRSSYGFTIEVPVAAPTNSDDDHGNDGCNSTRIETFEWRRSRGPAVKLLGHGSGYKLVRFATDAGNGGGEIATGGGEVVAVLAMERPWR